LVKLIHYFSKNERNNSVRGNASYHFLDSRIRLRNN
jgi:hypothetical protein